MPKAIKPSVEAVLNPRAIPNRCCALQSDASKRLPGTESRWPLRNLRRVFLLLPEVNRLLLAASHYYRTPLMLTRTQRPDPLGPHSAVVRPDCAVNSTGAGTRRLPRPSSKCLAARLTSSVANVLHSPFVQCCGDLAQVLTRSYSRKEVRDAFEA